MTYHSENGRRRGSSGTCSEVERFCLQCRMASCRFGVKSNEKVLSWNVLRRSDGKTDLILAQISMLTECDAGKIEVNGAHELFTPGKLRCPAKYRIQRWVNIWKLLESEQTDCSLEKWPPKCSNWWLASMASTETMASMASMAPEQRKFENS